MNKDEASSEMRVKLKLWKEEENYLRVGGMRVVHVKEENQRRM